VLQCTLRVVCAHVLCVFASSLDVCCFIGDLSCVLVCICCVSMGVLSAAGGLARSRHCWSMQRCRMGVCACPGGSYSTAALLPPYYNTVMQQGCIMPYTNEALYAAGGKVCWATLCGLRKAMNNPLCLAVCLWQWWWWWWWCGLACRDTKE
jgi:hypothetical protein